MCSLLLLCCIVLPLCGAVQPQPQPQPKPQHSTRLISIFSVFWLFIACSMVFYSVDNRDTILPFQCGCGCGCGRSCGVARPGDSHKMTEKMNVWEIGGNEQQ